MLKKVGSTSTLSALNSSSCKRAIIMRLVVEHHLLLVATKHCDKRRSQLRQQLLRAVYKHVTLRRLELVSSGQLYTCMLLSMRVDWAATDYTFAQGNAQSLQTDRAACRRTAAPESDPSASLPSPMANSHVRYAHLHTQRPPISVRLEMSKRAYLCKDPTDTFGTAA